MLPGQSVPAGLPPISVNALSEAQLSNDTAQETLTLLTGNILLTGTIPWAAQ